MLVRVAIVRRPLLMAKILRNGATAAVIFVRGLSGAINFLINYLPGSHQFLLFFVPHCRLPGEAIGPFLEVTTDQKAHFLFNFSVSFILLFQIDDLFLKLQ